MDKLYANKAIRIDTNEMRLAFASVNSSETVKASIEGFRNVLMCKLDLLYDIEQECKVAKQLKETFSIADLCDAAALHREVLECRTAQFLSEIEIEWILKRLDRLGKDLEYKVRLEREKNNEP